MKTTRSAIALMTAGMIGISGSSYAQTTDFGKREYDNSCAVCHGNLGKGDGPYVSFEYTAAANLTTLAKRNNGVFPFQRVYEFIDGRQMVRAHGPKDMPIWGSRYMPSERGGYLVDPDYYNPEGIVRTRILALTEYLNRLQVK